MNRVDIPGIRKRHFTQKEFADLLGVRVEHWNRVERSKCVSVRRTSSLFKLAEVILTYKESGATAAMEVLMR